MLPHAWASFCAEFPDDPDPVESRCSGVGEYLAGQLRKAGGSVIGTELWRDCGYEVNCRINGKPIYFYVSYVGLGAVQYVLCCASDRGLIGWLKRVDHTAERWQLANALHRVMAADSHFRDIRWYVERGWAAGGDEPWVRNPACGVDHEPTADQPPGSG
jgi:hypothetical protein